MAAGKVDVRANDDDAYCKSDVELTWAVIPTVGVTLASSEISTLVTPSAFDGVFGFELPTTPT